MRVDHASHSQAVTHWGWSLGQQQTAEFNILAQYFSALLLIPFEDFSQIEFRPWSHRWYSWIITLRSGRELEVPA